MLSQIRTYSYTGNLEYFLAQKWWEPDELRGSCPVLRGAGAVMPRSTHPYLWTQEGWLYVAAVLDLFSRRIIGWAMAEHMRETLVSAALQMAIVRRQPDAGLLHHSDRGVQYASARYRAILSNAGMIASMSRKGNCWDNSVMERAWGSLKSERTDGMRYPNRATAKADVIDYFEMFYNSSRLHSTLGYVSPLQFENQYRLTNLSTST